MKKIDQEFISRVLRDQVKPSTGCTEPVAVALATSIAYHAILGKLPKFLEIGKSVSPLQVSPHNIEEIAIEVNRDTYKNSLVVGIPGTPNLQGINIAAALGLFCDPNRELNLFSDSNDEKVSLAIELLDKNKVKIDVTDTWKGHSDINIRVYIKVEGHVGEVWIQHEHSNITYIRRDDKILYDKRHIVSKLENLVDMKYLAKMDLTDLLYAIENLLEEDKNFINDGIEMNEKASEIGIRKKLGLGVGYRIQELIKEKMLNDDIVNQAKSKTAGAGDARMSGYNISVMSSSGSGNQGIVATLPIVAVAEETDLDKERLIKAVALSYLITAYVTYYSGYLSALCGCAIKAGIGATAGITYYLGGNAKTISAAINNIAANITGMICDGAKVGCALKMATAAGTAVESALFAIKGINVPSDNGIVAENLEETIKNIGRVSEGMISTDKSVVKILVDKQKRLYGKS